MTSAPRIAYLTSEYPAVSHTFILREVEALRRQGLTVETVSIRSADPRRFRGHEERAAAASTYYLIAAAKRGGPLLAAFGWAIRRPSALGRTCALAWRTRGTGARALLWQLFYWVEAILFAHHVVRARVTQIHNHFAKNSATVAMLAAELTDVPFSLTIHGPSDFTETAQWHMGEKVGRAAWVACISHFARSQVMLHSAPAHWDRLRIIHCGVEADRYSGSGPTGQKVVFVGRLAAAKGLPVLLSAWESVRAKRQDLELVVVGDGPDRDALEHAAGRMRSSITFTGVQSQDEVAATLADAAAFVLPSFAEGVPVVLMEAMAAGLPVVATRIAGISELVDDPEMGRLVAPGDPEALAAAILEVTEVNSAAHAMGAAGRDRVRADFAINQEAARLARLFRDGPGRRVRPRA